MLSKREILEEMAGNKGGLITLRREVLGAIGKVHRYRARVVDELVREGLAIWENRSQTIARIASPGLESLKD